MSAISSSSPARPGVLAALGLCVLLSALGGSVATVTLPSLALGFGQPVAAVQWVVVAYLLALTTLVVGAGRLSDLWGRRRLLLAGTGLFLLASLLCAAAPDLWLLVAARILQGAGAAVMMAVSMALIGDVIPKDRTGRAMGMMGTLSAIGTACGPSVGGLLIQAWGWPLVFLAVAAVAAVVLGLVLLSVPKEPGKDGPHPAFDLRSMGLLVVALAGYALAMTGTGGMDLSVRGGLLAGAAVVSGLVLWSLRSSPAPLIRLDLLRDPTLRGSLLMGFLVSAVMMTTLVAGPFYLTQGIGLTAAQVGVAMSSGPVMSALSATPAGRLVDRFGADRVTRWGLSGMLIGCGGLAVQAGIGGWGGYVLALLVLTPGYALFQTANNTGVMRGRAADQRGVVSGLLNLSRNLGLVTGASAMGAVFLWGAGGAVTSAESAASGLRVAFGLALGLVTVALLTARVRSKISLA
ncbi:MFS transporter [Novispirillum itersonii]|uniref:MFS family permease n=1 Tax=Novispirillum itersonii TaxID=189 RepID=A0A7X0DNC0_NOVIT|nr:MFS transporter [Novispirillum itersonii]MBB6211936.1 MFS family permease [Novispirillum itersonii]